MSTIKTETLSTLSDATVPVDTVVNGTAKAWVNFNGTGTVAIRRAFNVSSITDDGTGNYRVNFTTAMVDSDYSTHVCSSAAVTNQGGFNRLNLNATVPTSVQVLHYENNSLQDTDTLTVTVFS